MIINIVQQNHEVCQYLSSSKVLTHLASLQFHIPNSKHTHALTKEVEVRHIAPQNTISQLYL
jgi:hypothetical protein